MKKEKSRIVYQAEPVRDFRELISRTATKYPDQVAYKYKIRKDKEEPEYGTVRLYYYFTLLSRTDCRECCDVPEN